MRERDGRSDRWATEACRPGLRVQDRSCGDEPAGKKSCLCETARDDEVVLCSDRRILQRETGHTGMPTELPQPDWLMSAETVY